MSERISRTYAFLKETFENTRWFQANPADKAYRFDHSVRVANICREIARQEGMDEEAAVIAGLLHDVAYGMDTPEGYDWKNHGRDGAKIARPFLQTLGLPEETVNDICYAIAIHVDDRADFEGSRTPFTEIVGDADNIDRFDAWRIYETVRYQALLEEKTLPEKLTWLRERMTRLDKLEKIDFATPAATALWRDKVAFQKQFFERLLAQMELSRLPEETEV